jgi:endo-1,4-beta-xylanase
LGVVGGKIQVAIFDGTRDTARTTRTFGSGYAGTVTLALARTGSTLHVYANGKQVGSLPDAGVLVDRTVWFGLDATLGGGYTLTSLTASGSVSIVDAPVLTQPVLADSLRKRAAAVQRPIRIGAAAATDPLFTESTYAAILGGQFSMITPENDLKPQFVHPQPGVYAFAEGDALVDLANANGIQVHAHTLVWQEALPQWMHQLPTSQVRAAMLDHIDHVAGHYAGKVAEWDVINEPIDDETNKIRTNTLWYKAMGASYIKLAFVEARKADPHAMLYLNEYGAEADGPKWDALLALMKSLKAQGVPVDGVGFQNHEYEKADRSDPATLARHVQALAMLGLKVRFSEMDVLVGSGSSQAQIQANEFAGKLAVCLSAPNCTSFTTWGFTDRYGSTADTGRYPPTPGNALPWDSSYQPKRAYSAMLDALH